MNNQEKMKEKINCHKCDKKISFFTGKGFDIKGNQFCGDCWDNAVDDVERDIMFKIRSKKKYNESKEQLKAEYQRKKKEKKVEVVESIEEESINKDTVKEIKCT